MGQGCEHELVSWNDQSGFSIEYELKWAKNDVRSGKRLLSQSR